MKALTVVKYAFAVVGIGMLIGATFLAQKTMHFLDGAYRAEGIVIDLHENRSDDSITYRPEVRFAGAQGRETSFISSSGSNPPSYTRGERVTVLYRPESPEHADIDDFFELWGGALIVGVLGGLFTAIGVPLIVLPNLARYREAFLRAHGTRLETTFQSVELDSSCAVNGRRPFRILSQWLNPATNEVHVFRSGPLWFDPSEYICGRSIRVYIEQHDPKKYFVDTSFLPRLVE